MTRENRNVTYKEVTRYKIEKGMLMLEQTEDSKTIIPLNRTILDVQVERAGTDTVPNGEFAGGDKN